MFRILTIEREYGSGGAAIARRVAQNLGWRLLDDDLVAAVARWAQVDVATARRYDECVDSWWHRINRGGISSAAIMAGVPPREVRFFDADTMAAMAQELILRAASKGNCVIVGRGAQCVLRAWKRVLHVFVHGPFSERVARVQSRPGTVGDADSLGSVDRARAGGIRHRFGFDWKDPQLYHMMLNTHLGIEKVASMITREVTCGSFAAISSWLQTAAWLSGDSDRKQHRRDGRFGS